MMGVGERFPSQKMSASLHLEEMLKNALAGLGHVGGVDAEGIPSGEKEITARRRNRGAGHQFEGDLKRPSVLTATGKGGETEGSLIWSVEQYGGGSGKSTRERTARKT